jgi:hypothetical protein
MIKSHPKVIEEWPQAREHEGRCPCVRINLFPNSQFLFGDDAYAASFVDCSLTVLPASMVAMGRLPIFL